MKTNHMRSLPLRKGKPGIQSFFRDNRGFTEACPSAKAVIHSIFSPRENLEKLKRIFSAGANVL